MKKIISLALLSFLILNLNAQNKFGYIDSQELLLLMPERKTAETEDRPGSLKARHQGFRKLPHHIGQPSRNQQHSFY